MSNPLLTKICSICGKQKPLSAFLQLTDQVSGSYGNICSSCRKTTLETPKEPEESTRSATGVKIDAKTKVQVQIDNRELDKEIKEQYFEDREEKDIEKITLSEKNKIALQTEKKVREHFLQRNRYPTTFTNTAPAAPTATSTETLRQTNKATEEKKANTEKQELSTGANGYKHFGMGDQVKLQSSVFQSFKTLLGSSAPVVRAAEKAAKLRNQHQSQNQNQNQNQTQNKNGSSKTATPQTPTDPLNEHVEKNYSPSRRR